MLLSAITFWLNLTISSLLKRRNYDKTAMSFPSLKPIQTYSLQIVMAFDVWSVNQPTLYLQHCCIYAILVIRSLWQTPKEVSSWSIHGIWWVLIRKQKEISVDFTVALFWCNWSFWLKRGHCSLFLYSLLFISLAV